LPYTELGEAQKIGLWLCESIRDLQLPHAQSEVAAHVSISVGLASCVPDGRSLPTSLLSDADDALYKAKANGRNRAVVSDRVID